MGSEVLLEQVQLNFSFRNKFIILPPCGLLVDNKTFYKIKKKMVEQSVQTQNVTPFLFERRRLKHGRGECEKWLYDII